MTGRLADRDLAFTAFAFAFFLFHQLVAAPPWEAVADVIDLLTPFAVIGAAIWAALVLRPSRAVLAVMAVAAVLYVDGHGIHLAANSINRWPTHGTAADRTHFWDEIWGHLEWHSGLLLLIGALAWADGRRTARRWLLVAAALLLGESLFTSGVEGGTWWLMLIAGAGVTVIALRRRTPIALACLGGFGLFALALAVWAVWQGGVPQFSEVGYI
jgi:hypothetical protein